MTSGPLSPPERSPVQLWTERARGLGVQRFGLGVLGLDVGVSGFQGLGFSIGESGFRVETFGVQRKDIRPA